MKRPNITPGPWIVSSFPQLNRVNVDGDNERVWIASVHSKDMKEPNAKAISAVPEMMEALEKMFPLFKHIKYQLSDPCTPLHPILTEMKSMMTEALLKAGYTELDG